MNDGLACDQVTLGTPDPPYMGPVTVKTFDPPLDVPWYVHENWYSLDASLDCGNYRLDWHAIYKDGIVLPNYDMNDSDILMVESSPVRKFIVQTMDETHVGTYEFRYIYSLSSYPNVTPSEEAVSLTLIV